MDKKEQIKEFLLQSIIRDEDDLDDNQELFSSGLVDSFSLSELVNFLQQDLALDIEDYDIIDNELNTVSKLASFKK